MRFLAIVRQQIPARIQPAILVYKIRNTDIFYGKRGYEDITKQAKGRSKAGVIS